MKRIDCLVADDEALAREIMERYIANIDTLNLVATCSTGVAVFNTLKSTPVELLFLDIQMPQLSGIELLRSLASPPAVIMTTAHREFALEGYELNVIDYLLKPISFERFLKAIEKFELFRNPGRTLPMRLSNEVDDDPNAFIYVKSDKKMVRVLLTDILYVEGVKDYVKIHTIDKPLITYQTLAYFEEKLSVDHFMRVHRSYIIAMQKIRAYSASQIEIGEDNIPIGSSYARAVHKKLTG